MNRFYVYVHRRETDNAPFYVGKGSGDRAWDKHGRNPYWKHTAERHGWRVEILFDGLCEEDAFRVEIDTILELKYFGYNLVNLTSGGEGPAGLKFSDKQRLCIAEGLKGRIPWNKGQKFVASLPSMYSDETRHLMSKAKLGKYAGDNNPFADTDLYTFVRLSDGFVVTCTRSQLRQQFGADQGIKKLFYKQPRKSASGWRLKSED